MVTYEVVVTDQAYFLLEGYYKSQYISGSYILGNVVDLNPPCCVQIYLPFTDIPKRTAYFEKKCYHSTSGPAEIYRDDEGRIISYRYALYDEFYSTADQWFKKLTKEQQIKALFNLYKWKIGEKDI